MTAKSDFSDEEWHLILEAPPSAGMIVVTAQHGGRSERPSPWPRPTLRPASSMVRASFWMRSCRRNLSGITRTTTPDELKQQGLQHLRQSVEVLERKATPVEVDEYRQFIVNLTHKVAAAHREHGQEVSDPEQAAIEEITAALNPTAG